MSVVMGCTSSSLRTMLQKSSRPKSNVINATGDLAIRAAQQATTTIPILAFTDDMLESKFVSSLAKPGGNTTGVSIFATELDGKRLEILIEAVPGLRRPRRSG